MHLGDAATWATATFTAIFAGIAYYQLKAQRQELSEKLSNVGDKLDELKADRIKQELRERREKWEQARRAQAMQVKLKRGDKVELLMPGDTTPTEYSYLAVTNQSDNPLHTVCATFHNKYAWYIGKLDPDARGPQQLQDPTREVLSEILPGETWYFLVLATSRTSVPDDQVYAGFTDANGVRWRKNLWGEFEDIEPAETAPPDQGTSLAERDPRPYRR
jgi:hypothetical protein